MVLVRSLTLILGLGLAAGFGAGSAGAEIIDLGSKLPTEVHFLSDPWTYVRIPPGAFGAHPPGTLADLLVDMPSCDGPNCLSGQGLLVSFDGRYSGDLVLPVTFAMRYDEELVEAYGIEEEEILFCRYDVDHRAWLPMADQRVDVAEDVVFASESTNIRQFVAVFAVPPQAIEPGTWGGVKALYAPRRQAGP